MKFQADREVLSDAISFVVRLLSPKPQLPQLSGVMIEAKDNQVVLSVFDYEVAAKVVISAAIDQPGKVLVQARLLAEIVSKLPADSVTVNFGDSRVQVSSGNSKFSLSSMSTTDYPQTPVTPAISGRVSAEKFSQAVSRVAVAASREEVTPVLTAVMISAKSKELTLVATDRFRVAVSSVEWQGAAADKEVLIPARVISEIAKTFAHEGDLEIALGESEKDMIGFTASNKSVSTATIKGKYPAVMQLFPDSVENFAVVGTHELQDATKRVGLVVEREKPLRYKFEASELSLESIGSDVADASEQVSCSLTGSPTTVSLRPQFLTDALSGVDSEMVKLGFTVNPSNPNKPGPVLISPADSKSEGNFKYLLQPNLLVS